MLFITALIFSNSQAESTSYLIKDDYIAALALAKETNMPLLAIFSAEWCGFCGQLKEDLPNIEDSDRYIICIIDIELNQNLKQKMGIKGLPTSVIIDQTNNNEISRKTGYKPAEYSRWLRRKSN